MDAKHDVAVVVYVVPTEKSLAAFEEICADIKLARSITDLVFLKQVHHGYGRMNSGKFMAKSESVILHGFIQVPHGFAINSETLGEAYAVYLELATAHDGSERTYQVMTACLPKLTALKGLAIQTKIDKPGLNEDRYFYSKSYHKGGEVAYSESTDPFEMLAYDALTEMRMLSRYDASFVDSLFRAFEDTGTVVTDLALGNGLNDQRPYDFSTYGSLPTATALHHVASNLKHLTLSIEDNDEKEDTEDWRDLIAAATELESLRIYPEWGYTETMWHRAQEFGTTLSTVLPHATFSKLRTFEIIGKLNRPTKVRAVSLNAFLNHHRDTLRVLELSGVLLVNWSRPQEVRSAMKVCLERVRETLSLDFATARIGRRSIEHENKACWGISKDGRNCDKTCRQYLLVGGVWTSVEELDGLAKDLKVQLNDGVWDFGEFLMRR